MGGNMTTSSYHPSWFSDWLLRAWPHIHQFIYNDKWFHLLPVLQGVGLITGIIAFIGALMNTTHRDKYLFYVNDVGHIVLLLIALFLFLPKLEAKRPRRYQEASGIVSKTVVQFKNWFYLLLILWLCFYICRAFFDYQKAFHPSVDSTLATYASFASPYINILSAFAFFGLYMSTEHAAIPGWSVNGRIWAVVVIIVLATTPQLTAHALGNTSYSELDRLAGILNGLIVGIATALFIGRLDSRYIGLHKAVITTLYGYALIQPLFPYLFQNTTPPDTSAILPVIIQYVFVAIALVMKSVLIVATGKIIDTRTLHFYISSMRWLDKHAATLKAQYEKASTSDGGLEQSGPYLFSLVPPDLNSATIRMEKIDVQLRLGILNAWIGVGWDVKDLRATKLTISETELPIKVVRMVDPGSVRVSENDKFTRVKIDVDIDLPLVEFKKKLAQDPKVSQAINRNQKTKRLDVILHGLEACTSIIDDREPYYTWHRLESVDWRNYLCYSASLDIETLN